MTAHPAAFPRYVSGRPDVIVFLEARPGCRHDVGPDCALHGCPYCQDELERKPWIDPCQTCVQKREQTYEAFVDLNPLIRCEIEGHLNCEVCQKCHLTGEVCRDCGLCVEHEEDLGLSPCVRPIWSRSRRREVEYFRHSLFDPKTGRWT